MIEERRVFGGEDTAFHEEDAAALRVEHVFIEDGPDETRFQAVHDGADARRRACPFLIEIEDDDIAVFLADDDVLRYVYQTAGKVTGVRRTERRIGQTLAGAVGRGEVIQHGQAFAVVRLDRQFDRTSGRIGDEPAHAGELSHLAVITAGAGLGHHGEGVEFLHALLHGFAHFVGRLGPDLDDFLISFRVGDEAAAEEILDSFYFGVFLRDDLVLIFRHGDVIDADGNAGDESVMESQRLDAVQEVARRLEAELAEAVVHELAHLLLVDDHAQAFSAVASLVEVPEHFRDGVVEDHAARRGDDEAVAGDVHADEVLEEFAAPLLVLRLIVGEHDLIVAGVGGELVVFHGLFVFRRDGEVVAAEDHILRRNGDRLAVLRGQDVVDGEHERARFRLGLYGQRQVARHLVAVEVGVVARADQRMQLDRAAFPEDRLEGLDAEAVQRRGAVQQDRMLLDDVGEDVPHFRRELVHFLAGDFQVVRHAAVDELMHDERLEELHSHFFRQAALVHLQFRADNDNGTAGVVDALAEEVLAEAALLALQHVGEGFQGAVARAGDGSAAAAVVDEGVYRFLEHALFIADDDLRSAQFEEALQTVVSVDDAAVEIIEIARREAAAVELHHGAQIRRDDRDHGHDHPFRLVPGLEERFHLFQTADAAHAALSRARLEVFFQLFFELFQIQFLQERLDRFRAHARLEGITAVFLHGLLIFRFRQELLLRQIRRARIEDDVRREVEHPFQSAGRNGEDEADAGGDALEIPDMGHRAGQADVAHALAAHLGARHFDAALVAHRALIAHSLVLAALAFPVLGRSENLFAEEAVGLRLQGAIIDGLRLGDFAVGPLKDLFRGGDADFHGIEFIYI